MQRFRSCQRGSQVIELALVLLPMFAIMFLMMDSAWAVFAKASLQYAVRQGCRYAVTSQTLTGMGQDASIKTVVQNCSLGFLSSGANSQSNVSISYFNPSTLQPTNSNAGGNIVQVAINSVAVTPLVPLWRSSAPLQISAVSSDVMESSPNGIPPAR